MLPAVTRAQSAQQSAVASREVSVIAPVLGLNTRDSISALQPGEASELCNMIPGRDGVLSRKGSTDFVVSVGGGAATELDGTVETIVEYEDQSTEQGIAAGGEKIYSFTSSGLFTQLGTGFTNSRWNTAQSNNILAMCNGADAPQQWDGSTLGAISFTGSATPANFVDVMIHQSRAFYIENEAPWFWYAGAGAYAGALTKFDLSQIALRGGNIKAFGSWSRDGGSGPDDYAVFCMTTGEIIIYQGTNPGDAAAWSLVGRYYAAPVVDVRGVMQAGNDLYLMTISDYIPLSAVIAQGRITEGVTKLAGAARDTYQQYSGNTGFEAILFPGENWLLFNVPTTSTKSIQYGVYTPTNAPFQLKGWNARCFGVVFNQLYMGQSDGSIKKCATGLSDDGVAIEILANHAFDKLRTGQRKNVTAFRPLIQAGGDVNLSAGVAYDYGTANIFQEVQSATSGTPWGSAWGSPWSPGQQLRDDVYGSDGEGRNVSLTISTKVLNQQIGWYGTDYLFKVLRGFS